ncbi:hypothetical protein [Treponema putidum]|uniref:Uncharacterized protein n=1 Tax=Treponema putidum TaxID=221027 RepID=A0AAE9MUK7_9SPIR|nr:hypothetical protein [Treponema putidum]AIN94181.1 hypothetical protein JO40_08765 [Treponema putidum]TWI79648.1 hypothetical protein JM98_00079 [Treponema putidum]UTY28133.1 hypothetical protein E4N76_03425 [Treponema putidum]UTY33041.1 hypothetical protein E4N74_02720 [Treponema putidum]
MLKKHISCILFFIFFGFAFADTAAFACFQNKDAHEKCRNITEIFEDNLFDKFFDEGFIATNIPISEVKSEKDISLSEIKSSFQEEPNYLIVFYMQYGNELLFNKKNDSKEPDWQALSIRVINCKKEKEIYKKNIDITKLKEEGPEKKALKLADQISKEVFEAINRQ